ncbi:MAG: NAD-dependent succinate-semialdehyde dehydrogenase [Chitinophagales bacterium]|nr:NAD-dependent succinate-semialdehyde dehydrogenase [Chitinophagales bacterium]
MKTFLSVNPFDQSVVAEHPLMTDAQLNDAITRTSAAYDTWKKSSFSQRSDLLLKVADLLRAEKEKFALTISTEMGKILPEARSEIEKCAGACEYYATHGEALLQDEMIAADAKKSFVTFQPVGAVFAIMPWNFPFWQVIRFAAPALMAGNVVLLKHAPNVSQCSKELEQLFITCGATPGLFQSLIVDTDVTEKIISSNIVQGVTLTGSEFAGATVASLAGKHIKKSVLELGGSDPLIVLEDADIARAAKVALQSRMQNAGQSCIASKRFIVLKKIKDAFLQELHDGAKRIRQGNQLLVDTQMGPMARIDLAEKLEQQQQICVSRGVEILTGGKRSGNNYAPTLLTNARPGVPAFDEEMFGPVAAVISAQDETEAVSLANMNRYGLGASIWTRDLERGAHIARLLDAGGVFINALVKSDVRLPFGGIKKSGYGRELSGYGMKEFTNIKTIYIEE